MTEAESKTVYLIRHAESEENHRIASLFRSFGSLGRFTLPSSSDVGAAMSLINIPAQIDSEVSEIGSQQILQLAEKLKK
eukprot:CAMPEP_0202461526 /NCGR_PEP_ID=MMETSP1360-20130828/49805_1 /ASSEMBLY_ACC=CAM_ASM_000848 /TAXON_ID=515479 /ORGANISM="Licmophora paradoxa, Strain CCMP2313" /LENGTH=78 /DNA_ID=CAMNT_0049083611 /DNA_START=36 /DNA_END=269 /DNA_ORIENTATION=-